MTFSARCKAHFSAMLPDTLPQRLEDRVKRLDAVRGRSLCQSRESQGSNRAHLLLLVHKSCMYAIDMRERGTVYWKHSPMGSNIKCTETQTTKYHVR